MRPLMHHSKRASLNHLVSLGQQEKGGDHAESHQSIRADLIYIKAHAVNPRLDLQFRSLEDVSAVSYRYIGRAWFMRALN